MRSLRGLALDAAFLALFTTVAGPPAAATAWLVATVPLAGPVRWVLAPVWAVVFLALMLLAAWAVRLALPRLEPGNHAFPGSPAARAWLLHFALARVLGLPLWSWLILAFSSLRWLALRARGARVAFDFDMSLDARIGDAPLVEVGERAMLGSAVELTGHFIRDGRLLLGPVVVGRGVQLLTRAGVSPGCTLEEGAILGPGSALLPGVRVGRGARIGLSCVLHSDVQVGAGAVLGHNVVLEAGVVVGDGAAVPTGTRVPRGTRIPPAEPRAAETA